MAGRRRGLHLLVGAGLFVVFAVYLVQSAPGPETAVTGQQVAPNQGERLLMPFVPGDDQADAESPAVEPQVEGTPVPTSTPTPVAAEPTLLPEVTRVHSFAEETRGQVINLGGIEVKLPDDAYVEGVAVSAYPVPGDPNPPIPPIIMIRRNESVAAVEYSTGRIWLGEPQDVARQEFDFLVQALGEDKIVTYPTPEATDVAR